jgi:hypothetical protein
LYIDHHLIAKLICILNILTEGPLYTMGKGHVHDIVRALETHPKVVPWKIEIEFCAVMGLQATGLSTKR